MHEHPEGVELLEAHSQQVADDKIDALCVTHLGEIICEPFQNSLKSLFLCLRKLTSPIDIFFDLGELVVLVYYTILLHDKLVMVFRIYFGGYLVVKRGWKGFGIIFTGLVVETHGKIRVGGVEAVEDDFPLGEDAGVDGFVGS